MKVRKIASNEREIRGEWLVRQGEVQADANCRRIEALLSDHLHILGTDASGWDQLYQDPDDGRYWELTYPQSELHGGGPQLLRCLTLEEVKEKYSHIVKYQEKE
jgi:hypothetical protein